jgi:hypothetical protein
MAVKGKKVVERQWLMGLGTLDAEGLKQAGQKVGCWA